MGTVLLAQRGIRIQELRNRIFPGLLTYSNLVCSSRPRNVMSYSKLRVIGIASFANVSVWEGQGEGGERGGGEGEGESRKADTTDKEAIN